MQSANHIEGRFLSFSNYTTIPAACTTLSPQHGDVLLSHGFMGWYWYM